ncbi:LD-carboxypeptidase [Paenibacillus sp. CFBP13512]|uniref:S66 family peptidase n=1 Tax=Paenibacillus sp. CFBP13512 TaxID=2184007 RepID=UPI0010C0C679|nr:S66 peptidase family protein [Paenibacillus sp. CFBP13512]TKJ93351.1 LD-carboxypeptidase [Paenibacillus sp. CFBP13512]
MIRYPYLYSGTTIGITAPSSGVSKPLHYLIEQATERLKDKGYKIYYGETIWTQNKAKSASAQKRVEELNYLLQDDKIGLILPPWGGELLIEIIEKIEYDKIEVKWIMGYSDISLLLLAVTLKTGIATAHSTNLVDIRGKYTDSTTLMWEKLLKTEIHKFTKQSSSELFQKEWNHDYPSPYVFHLTEKTSWKMVSKLNNVRIKGRLLGGCIDVIRHLIGTEFGDVQTFQREFLNNEPLIWYFENSELSVTDLRRSLIQMRLAGWFENCKGLLFGRSQMTNSQDNYTVLDVYRELSQEIDVPLIYDIDCGHVPPQMTFINGAEALVEIIDGLANVTQLFKP